MYCWYFRFTASRQARNTPRMVKNGTFAVASWDRPQFVRRDAHVKQISRVTSDVPVLGTTYQRGWESVPRAPTCARRSTGPGRSFPIAPCPAVAPPVPSRCHASGQ
eukprot:8300167-Pyramimonas_sp.AAC.1